MTKLITVELTEMERRSLLGEANAKLRGAAVRLQRANEELEIAEREHREASEAVNRLEGRKDG